MKHTVILIIALTLLAANLARADCGIPFKPGVAIFEPNQRALIGYNGARVESALRGVRLIDMEDCGTLRQPVRMPAMWSPDVESPWQQSWLAFPGVRAGEPRRPK
jgi:hypothetical protein